DPAIDDIAVLLACERESRRSTKSVRTRIEVSESPTSLGRDVHPFSFSQGNVGRIGRSDHQMLSFHSIRFIQQYWQHIPAVGAFVLPRLITGQCSQCSEDIDVSIQLIRDHSGFDFSWPSGDERYAVPPFPGIKFPSEQVAIGFMACFQCGLTTPVE